MKDFKKIFSLLLVIAMLASMCVLTLTSCGDNTENPSENESQDQTEPQGPDDNTEPGPDVPTENKVDYTISVKSKGGMPLNGVTVLVYNGDNIAGYATSGVDGNAKVSLERNSGYTAKILQFPPEYTGYIGEESYPFLNNHADVIVTSRVIDGGTHSGYTLGSVMHDFTVTTYDGEREFTLSKVLEEKDMVLINFWYDGCTYCLQEFPEMEEMYRKYKDKVEIIALSPYDGDADIASFLNRYADRFPEGGLTFPIANDNVNLIFPGFNPQHAPTSIVVDRYGVVCLVIEGAMSGYQFEAIFSNFIGDNYEQKLITDPSVLTPVEKPNVSMPSSDEIAAVLNGTEGMNVTYHPEESESDAENAWPFIIGQKGGFDCIKTSNAYKHSTFSIMYADVELKAGQALAFDYWASTDLGNDVLYVIVDRESMYQISGDGDSWETCYSYVALEDGVYELALCYIKDTSTDVGDDTIYIKNLHIVDASEIDKETYIFRQASTDFNELGTGYNNYVDVVLGTDGYYHVSTADGPLLLANLWGYTNFSNDTAIWILVYNMGAELDGVDYRGVFEEYARHAGNSKLYGYTPVTEELREALEAVATIYGIEVDNENQWLQMCAYYDAYGTDGKQLEDPIKGLAPFSAFEAKLDVANEVEYTQIIMPRGYLYKFVPETSGAYRITSYSTAAGLTSGLDYATLGWVFDKNNNMLCTSDLQEKMESDGANISMVMYMEAGKEYYIDIAYNTVEVTGKFTFRIERIGDTADIFTLASNPGFTVPERPDGQIDYNAKPVAGGVDVMLVDGKYYVKNADGSQGSILYADFYTITGQFNVSLMKAIELGGFNFAKSALDIDIEGQLEANAKSENPVDEAKLFTDLWGEYIYEQRKGIIEEVKNGIYHGKGDYTDKILVFANNLIMDSEAEELNGCIEVTEELAEILQIFMDTHSFEGVEHSWTKLCFYYKHYGPTVSAE